MIRCNTHIVRACRKRSGLTQGELAELLGPRASVSAVSRLESGARKPDLKTVVALEVAFAAAARELLGDSYREVSRRMHMRARALRKRLSVREPDAAQKVEFLDDLIRRTTV